MNLLDLKKNLRKDFSKSKLVKVALLGDTATQLFVQALKGYGYEVQINCQIYEAEYDQIESEILDTSSKLYSFKPEYIVIFKSSQKLKNTFYKLNTQDKSNFADDEIKKITGLVAAINTKLPAKIICFNLLEPNDNIFGNYSNKVSASFLFQVRKFNVELMNMCRNLDNFFINDVCALQNQYGHKFIFDARNYVNADMVFSMDFLPLIAKNTLDIIQSLMGKIKKCLILDLDNTLWGGVIGDDGLANIEIGDLGIGKAFSELQWWVKQLKQRGILLAICSKNDEKIAKEPFLKHPEMILRLDDIAIFVANWNNKIDNIKHIQSVLNIGFDSMVFIDDNPFERDLVKKHIPELMVPELPEDPAEYVECLSSLNMFETSSYSQSDKNRTQQYQQEEKRKVEEVSFTNIDEYLLNLRMISSVCEFNEFNIPRVAQLTQRSNQFNLRTIRYTEQDIKRISESDNFMTLVFNLQDKFGDYGLISIIILEKRDNTFFIDTWIMSCRVIKRTVEYFVLNKIMAVSKEYNIQRIVGECIATAKNNLVQPLFQDLGFKKNDDFWYLDVKEFKPRNCYIKEN